MIIILKKNSKVQDQFGKVKNITKKILKGTMPIVAKGVTSVFGDTISSSIEKVSEEIINSYSENKEAIKEFKDEIKKLLEQIDNSKPFIIFIDELDRCRPIYSIELLERIKHIFGINGLIFVLSIDKNQLSESIKSQYGNIDTDNYLRRFIDLEYNLQNLEVNDFCKYLYHDYFKLSEILRDKKIEVYNNYFELEMIQYLVKSTKMTLREIEQVFTQISIIYKVIQSRFFEIHFLVIVIFVILKMKFSRQYELLKSQKLDEKELFDLLIIKDDNLKEKSVFESFIKAIILATSKTDAQLDKIIKEQKEILENLSKDKKYDQQELIYKLEYNKEQGFHAYRLNQIIKTVIKKVEFSDSFYY